MVRLRDIIGIFDIHIQEATDLSGLFQRRNREQPFITVQTQGSDVKSVVLTDSHIYLSPISSLTLKRRAANLYRDLEDMESSEPTS